MLGIVLMLMVLIGPIGLLFTFLYFHFPDESVGLMERCIPPLTSVLAIWSLCTAWMWFYLFNLYISLPTLLLSFIMHLLARSKNLNPKLRQVNALLIMAAFLVGLLSYNFFDI